MYIAAVTVGKRVFSTDLVGRFDRGRCGEQLSDDARHLKSSNIGIAGIFGQGTFVSGRLGNDC